MADISFQAKLVEAIEKHPHPCLYDFHLKEYSNREKVQSAWEAVAREVKNPVKECKETWRNLRIVFTRNIKKPPTGSKAKNKSWPLLQNMMFLKSYVTAKGNGLPGNLPSPPSQSSEADDTSADSESQEVEELHTEAEATGRENKAINPPSQETGPMGPPPKQKKKIQPTTADAIVMYYIRTKTHDSSDNPRKHFLLSLLPDVDEMTTNQFKNFRREVVNLIDGIVAPAWPTSRDFQFGYQQQPSLSPVSTHSWSGESSASTSTVNQLPVSEGSNIPQRDQLYTELEPFLTKAPL